MNNTVILSHISKAIATGVSLFRFSFNVNFMHIGATIV